MTLEANPDLSWRDIQHIIVETAKPSNLSSTDWQLNGAQRQVSHSFGYGMMDALDMIELAKRWVTVPGQHKCVIESVVNGQIQKPMYNNTKRLNRQALLPCCGQQSKSDTINCVVD